MHLDRQLLYPRAAQAADAGDGLLRSFRDFSRIAGTSMIVTGCFVLLCWIARIDSFRSFAIARLTVNPMSAFLLVVCGLSLRLGQETRPSAVRLRFAGGALVAAASAAELASGPGAGRGLDDLLFHHQVRLLAAGARITLGETLAFLCAGTALASLDFELRDGHRPSQYFAIGGLAIALMTLVSYGYGIHPLTAGAASVDLLELNSALAFALMHLGILCARPDRGLMALTISADPGGESVRRLIPAMIIVPTALAWARILSRQAGLYGSDAGTPLFAFVSIAVYAALIWWNAASLHEASETRARSAREMQEAADMKAEFAAIVSHELRTPLTAVKISIDMAASNEEDPERRRRFLTISKSSVDRLARLINEVLDFQKLDAGKQNFRLQSHDLNALVVETAQSFAPLAQQRGTKVEVALAEGLPAVVCDKDKVTQVVLNLVNNAVKFCPQGPVTLRTELRDGGVRVSVRDAGPGISAEDQAKLFRSFSQIPASGKTGEGSGLGLAISRKIVEHHGGRIGVESEFGKGATFYFTLPLGDAK